MKKVYIAHPLRGDVEGNTRKATKICQELTREGNVIPFSPLHAFNFLDPKGDQSVAMNCCYTLLKSCDELWLHGNWKNSEGCKLELIFATEHGIPVKVVGQ